MLQLNCIGLADSYSGPHDSNFDDITKCSGAVGHRVCQRPEYRMIVAATGAGCPAKDHILDSVSVSLGCLSSTCGSYESAEK